MPENGWKAERSGATWGRLRPSLVRAISQPTMGGSRQRVVKCGVSKNIPRTSGG